MGDFTPSDSSENLKKHLICTCGQRSGQTCGQTAFLRFYVVGL